MLVRPGCLLYMLKAEIDLTYDSIIDKHTETLKTQHFMTIVFLI